MKMMEGQSFYLLGITSCNCLLATSGQLLVKVLYSGHTVTILVDITV